MSNEVVPALAPHVDVLATITGMTLDLLHFIVEGRPGLLVRRISPGRGRRHHWALIQARGAYWRSGLCSGRGWDSPLFGKRRSRGSTFLLYNVARGRRPRGLSVPRRGARHGPCRGRMLLGALSRGRRRGLLRGLRRGVSNDSNRLGFPLASNVVRVDVRCRADKKATFKQCQQQQ